MKRLLICCPKQWGYHVDSYKMALHFQDKYAVTYVSWDHGYKAVHSEGVEVIYVSRAGSLPRRNLRFLLAAARAIVSVRPDIVFLKYFPGCSLMRLAAGGAVCIFDIRTGSVRESPGARKVHDAVLKCESRAFRHVTVISRALAQRLGMAHRATVLPLGSEVMSSADKSFRRLRLLYVGTLNNRNIRETVRGVAEFRKKHGEGLIQRYTIVGDGREYRLLEKEIARLGLEHLVHLKGRVPLAQLGGLFDSHNVGVSFVPITPYYDCQPVGKTFDYLLSGLVVIATATGENAKVVNRDNGVCTTDNARGFAEGLLEVRNNRDRYDSARIRRSATRYSWPVIFREFDDYLDALLKHRDRSRAQGYPTG